jgi:archaetidylinositol phosphate synthase
MLNRLRDKVEPMLEGLARYASKVFPRPWCWSLLGLLMGIAAGYFFYVGNAPFAGLFILLSGFFDVLDGAVAKVLDSESKRGAFLDSNLDRVSEVAIYLGILLGGYAHPAIVMLAMAMALLVSYARARVEGLGRRVKGLEMGERAERLLVLAVFSFLGLVLWGVWIVLLLASATYLERIIIYYKGLE